LNVIPPVGAAMLRQLTGQPLPPILSRLFHRGRVLVAHDHIEVWPDLDSFNAMLMPSNRFTSFLQ